MWLSPPWCYVTFLVFRFLRFYLSAMPSLLPATFSRLRPSLFSSDPPPCYIIPPFDAQTHLGSNSIILI
jgi:hypothetical protein